MTLLVHETGNTLPTASERAPMLIQHDTSRETIYHMAPIHACLHASVHWSQQLVRNVMILLLPLLHVLIAALITLQ
jgi:hypothetical protein